MPIYEYRCDKCGLEKEYLQKLGADPISTCPSCGESSMTKLISAAGFQLKGSGWYATDFKHGGKPATAKKADDTSAEGKPAEPAKAAESTSGGAAPATPAAVPDA